MHIKYFIVLEAEINVSDQEIVFQLKPKLIRLPPPRLEDFGISPDVNIVS